MEKTPSCTSVLASMLLMRVFASDSESLNDGRLYVSGDDYRRRVRAQVVRRGIASIGKHAGLLPVGPAPIVRLEQRGVELRTNQGDLSELERDGRFVIHRRHGAGRVGRACISRNLDEAEQPRTSRRCSDRMGRARGVLA